MSTSTRRPLILIAAVLGAGVLVAITAAVTFFIMHDTRQDIRLADIAASDWSPDPTPEIYVGMRDKTETLCAGVEGCVEGFEADHVSYFKFTHRYQAAAFARETSDAYQSDWIVIQFTDDTLTATQRLETRQIFDELAISD